MKEEERKVIMPIESLIVNKSLNNLNLATKRCSRGGKEKEGRGEK
jgi:hypothetical protein